MATQSVVVYVGVMKCLSRYSPFFPVYACRLSLSYKSSFVPYSEAFERAKVFTLPPCKPIYEKMN